MRSGFWFLIWFFDVIKYLRDRSVKVSTQSCHDCRGVRISRFRQKWPVRIVISTYGFQPYNRSLILLPATILKNSFTKSLAFIN